MSTSFSKRKAGKEKAQRTERQVADLDEFLLDQEEEGTQKIPDDRILVVLPPSRFYVDEQVRKKIDPHEIEQRAASMRTNGQLQAIVVYPADTEGKNKGEHKIDKGECRWRAAQLIDGFELKAIVDPEAPKRNKRKRIVGQIVENDQRADLRPLEMALALDELLSDGMTQEEVAIELGWITRSKKPNINKVSRILSILKLPEEGQKLAEDHIVTDLITLEFLRKIYEVNPNKFSVLCDLAREDEGLSRKRAEQEYKQCKANENQESPDESSGDATGEQSASVDQSQAAGTTTENVDSEFSHERNESTGQSDVEAEAPTAAAESQGSAEVAGEFNEKPQEPLSSNQETVSENETVKSLGNATAPTSKSNPIYPVIKVEWRGMQRGTLVFDQEPEEKGYIWLKLEKTGDLISAELEDLTIKSVSV
ncbi:MAG: ParB/RepB/Spo0J family partition protein [Candidatus Thiodiazotropha endolucinida]|nr:ParB/RepB/Spo0J family partition protein [Candidatus Thiodiazotropha taylori]MCW4350138.1 ParB/RepB/Spo0J family partition protein [Candidatus Thiodiazotropha endolucinida]